MTAATEANAAPGELAEEALEQERLGRWDEAARLYSLAFRASLLAGDLEHAADSLRGQARVRQEERRFDEAEELAELSREIAERAGLSRSAARAVNVLGLIRYARGDWAGARAYYQRAIELALDTGDDDLAGLAFQNAGIIANIVGDRRESRTLYLESIGSFVRSGNSANAMLAYNNLGIVCADLREWLEAEVYFGRGIEIAERLSSSPVLARLCANLAEPLIHMGETERAVATLERAEAIAHTVHDTVALSEVWRYRALMARLAGRLDEAERHVAKALEVARVPGLRLETAEALRELGELRRAEGRGADALAALLEARDIFASLGAEHDVRVVEELLAGLEGEEPRSSA
jgi:tetratricopeptide (TPR) repeat protein